MQPSSDIYHVGGELPHNRCSPNNSYSLPTFQLILKGGKMKLFIASVVLVGFTVFGTMLYVQVVISEKIEESVLNKMMEGLKK